MEPRAAIMSACGKMLALAMAAALLSGCIGLEAFLGPKDPAPTGTVCRIITTWAQQVAYTPDPAHGGAETAGLAGRLYLFGPEIGFPLVGDGTLTVDLYDARPEVNGGQPLMLEQWRFDRDTLKRLLKKDTIGWGYTLFLPWGTFKPEINRVLLKVRYDPAKGTPLFSDPSALMLPKAAALGRPAVK